jgi:hypothetical protein
VTNALAYLARSYVTKKMKHCEYVPGYNQTRVYKVYFLSGPFTFCLSLLLLLGHFTIVNILSFVKVKKGRKSFEELTPHA